MKLDKIKSSIIHAASLAHSAITQTRSWCADSQISRVRLTGKMDQAQNEISLLKEEMRIKDARTARTPPHHRPFYPPTERLAILEVKSIRGWNLSQTAKSFLVDPDTISDWLKRVDTNLTAVHPPINKYKDYIQHLVRRLKTLCPSMGKIRIAQTLARAGYNISSSSVQRFLKLKSPPSHTPAASQSTGRIVTARHPNHVWHVDLTVVPTSHGFWQSFFPFSIFQAYPFCYWVAVVIDHFSRKVIGYAVFLKQPKATDITRFLGRTISLNKAKPGHIISDQGKQFVSCSYCSWARWKKIKLRYGAIGQYGSIAVVERFIRSMKEEFTSRILIPMNLADMRYELGCYVDWYNDHRPHQFLHGARPQELMSGRQTDPPAFKKDDHLDLCVSYFKENRLLPIIELRKAA